MTPAEYARRLGALKRRFPALFAGRHIGRTVAPGWLGLVEDLCARIDGALSADERPRVHWVQIKEKFGGLRAYLNVAPPRVDVIGPEGAAALRLEPPHDPRDPSALNRRLAPFVRAAEAESHRRCAFCGAPGRLRTDRAWILTLCDRHAPFDYRHLDLAFAAMTDPERDPRPPTTSEVAAALRRAETELRARGVTRLGIAPPRSLAADWCLVVARPGTLPFEARRLAEERVGWPVAFVSRRSVRGAEVEVAWVYGRSP